MKLTEIKLISNDVKQCNRIFLWRILSDPKSRADFEKDIDEQRAKDDALASKNPYGYLPGLSNRLRYTGYARIYDRLKSEGLDGEALCLVFLNEMTRDQAERLIYAHEGRHSIDKRYFPNVYRSWGAEEQEFRAKLSEITFALDPKLSFANIPSPYLGNKNIPHAMADEQLR